MWSIKFDAPRGKRVQRYFTAVTTDLGSNLWFDPSEKRWLKLEDISGRYTHMDTVTAPKTVRAFIRYLEKHSELRGQKVSLLNRYQDEDGSSLDVTAVWEE